MLPMTIMQMTIFLNSKESIQLDSNKKHVNPSCWNNENKNDNSIMRNNHILLDTSSDDDENIVDTLLVDNER